MDFKLIGFGLVFGIAALVIYSARRANSPEARRKAGPSLDTQIGTLAEMGLPLSHGLTRDDLLAWGPEKTYCADPWRLILMTYASPADHRDDRPFCPHAAMIDMEGADDQNSYATLVQTLARVAGLSDRLHDVGSDGQSLTYRLDETSQDMRLDKNRDWFDQDALERVTRYIETLLPEGTHLWALENGQALAVFRLSDTDAQRLNSYRPGLLNPLAP